jgi:hypothetical protein
MLQSFSKRSIKVAIFEFQQERISYLRNGKTFMPDPLQERMLSLANFCALVLDLKCYWSEKTTCQNFWQNINSLAS